MRACGNRLVLDMSPEPNLLKILEAGTGIEPVFTDLQSEFLSFVFNVLR